MKNVLLTAFLLMFSVSSMALNNWNSMSCSGIDNTGQYLALTTNSTASRATINGTTLKIIGNTKDGNGVVTQNFVTSNNVAVYDSLTPASSKGLVFVQYNAVTNAILATARLSCLFNGNNASRFKVSEQSIFEGMHN